MLMTMALQNSLEKQLLLDLVQATTMIQVVDHLTHYCRQSGCASFSCGHFSPFHNSYKQIERYPTPTLSSNAPTTPQGPPIPWPDTAPSLDQLAARLSDNTNQKRLVVTTGSNVMVALRLDRPTSHPNEQFGVLAFIAPVTSLLFAPAVVSNTTLPPPAPTAPDAPPTPSSPDPTSPSAYETTLLQVAESSLWRTCQRDLLQQHNDMFAHIKHIQGMGLGVLAIDLDGRVVHYNDALSNMVGWTLEDVQSKGWTNLVYPNPTTRANIERAIAMLMMTTKGHTMNRRLTTKSGSTDLFTITSFSVKVHNGGPGLLVGLIRTAEQPSGDTGETKQTPNVAAAAVPPRVERGTNPAAMATATTLSPPSSPPASSSSPQPQATAPPGKKETHSTHSTQQQHPQQHQQQQPPPPTTQSTTPPQADAVQALRQRQQVRDLHIR